jgi:Arc/MetJ family transcription regulator
MTVTIDEELIARAREELGVATKSEAIRIALRELLRQRRLGRILARRGKVELDLDQEGLRRMREQS